MQSCDRTRARRSGASVS
uniref:Uncharacterized protein n=1 Tax=Arundo donax TaxID=35708 RepID=A0A0A9HNI8_ARUDO